MSLRTCCYDRNSRMSFKEPNSPGSCQIDEILRIELATYDERITVLILNRFLPVEIECLFEQIEWLILFCEKFLPNLSIMPTFFLFPGSELISSINIDGSNYKEYSTGSFIMSLARIENIYFWITLDNGNNSRPPEIQFP